MALACTRRTSVFALAAGLAVLDLAVKGVAERAWATTPVDLGILQLRLAYNRGMAFSVGSALPGWLILTLTAALTIGLGVYLWRDAPAVSRPVSVALAAILAGAAANLIDRAGDGVVTDYLHTGWWPTFNLADVLIVTGGILAALLSLRSEGSDAMSCAPAVGDPRPEAVVE